ncbi:MAG: VOC family protein [Mesorhizobium sp.]|nr:VOC family protein [Mesorhizobium sp.]
MSTRAIDHLVLPTADLDVARARLTALGFTVAPTGVHPFGTQNACVYLSDGTFLEPLAIGDAQAAEKAAAAGNVFVARDREYRDSDGEEGFSALVFASEDARADHEEFVAEGISAGDMLTFSRPVADAEGHTDTATFKLAFAADPLAPDLFFFTCQRKHVPKIDRSALQLHDNGASAIASVVLSAANPAEHTSLVNFVCGGVAAPVGDTGLGVQTPNAEVLVLGSSELDAVFGVRAPTDGLRLRAIVFRVPDIDATEALLRSDGIVCRRHGARLVVPPAPGQGAIFAFEE